MSVNWRAVDPDDTEHVPFRWSRRDERHSRNPTSQVMVTIVTVCACHYITPTCREILMTASPNIKTPAMDVPLLSHEAAREKGAELKKMFTRVCLSDVSS